MTQWLTSNRSQWDWTTSIEEVMDSLHILVQQGKVSLRYAASSLPCAGGGALILVHPQVLYLGISDSPAWVAAAANTYARAHGKTPFSIYQGRWNVMLRDMENEIIPMALKFGKQHRPLYPVSVGPDLLLPQAWPSRPGTC